jgi:molybdate/tungstate transport system substrate-binding protein
VIVPLASLAVLLFTVTAAPARAADLAGPLVVLNAGSLANPLGRALAAFHERHPGVVGQQESAGSLDLVRRVTELGRRADVLAVADFEVLPALVVPKHARWYLVFAHNRLGLAHRNDSRGAADLGRAPWYEVLLRPGVEQGHSDPDADPAGYRTLLAWQLAERHYKIDGLARRLAAAVPARNVRPKSVELVALLQASELDYAWTYASVAEDAGLAFFRLPPEIDLGDPALAKLYASATVEVAGNTPGTRRMVRGLPILYGLTIPTDAPNPDAATAFVEFLLGDEGRATLRAAHLEVVEPAQASDPATLPEPLRARCAPLAFAPPGG